MKVTCRIVLYFSQYCPMFSCRTDFCEHYLATTIKRPKSAHQNSNQEPLFLPTLQSRIPAMKITLFFLWHLSLNSQSHKNAFTSKEVHLLLTRYLIAKTSLNYGKMQIRVQSTISTIRRLYVTFFFFSFREERKFENIDVFTLNSSLKERRAME